MKSLRASLLVGLSLLFSLTAFSAPRPKEAPAQPLSAQAYFLLDLDTGRVLAEQNAHQRMFPASTTKIMTCMVALEHADIGKVIKVTKHASDTGESGVGLLAGEQLTLGDLIRAALIHSANDACVAIADGVAGDSTKFVGWMNAKAKALGCRDTHFMNPHGLHNPDHYTSAHDLAVIGRAALKVSFINKICREKTDSIPGNWKVGPQRVLINRNKLLFRWNACDGLKTGYTRQAGNCLVASATLPDPETHAPWRLLCVVMKCASGHSWPDAQNIIEHQGFDAYRPETVAKAGEVMHEGQVPGGTAELQAVTARAVRLPLRGDERDSLTHTVHIFRVTAPLAKGQPVGHVEYFANEGGEPRRLADLPLVAAEEVPQTVLAKSFPGLGNLVALRTPAARLLFVGVLCLGAVAILLIRRGNINARRRSVRGNNRTATPSRAGAANRAFDEYDGRTAVSGRSRRN